MKIVLRTFLAYLIVIVAGSLLWWLISPANAHAAGSKTIKEISYPTLFGVISAGLFVTKIVEQLLSKAGLLKSDKEKQIQAMHDWIFERREGLIAMVEELHGWHKPIETASGSKFSWRHGSDEHALIDGQLKRIEEAVMACAKISLRNEHRQDLLDIELEKKDAGISGEVRALASVLEGKVGKDDDSK